MLVHKCAFKKKELYEQFKETLTNTILQNVGCTKEDLEMLDHRYSLLEIVMLILVNKSFIDSRKIYKTCMLSFDHENNTMLYIKAMYVYIIYTAIMRFNNDDPHERSKIIEDFEDPIISLRFMSYDSFKWRMSTYDNCPESEHELGILYNFYIAVKIFVHLDDNSNNTKKYITTCYMIGCILSGIIIDIFLGSAIIKFVINEYATNVCKYVHVEKRNNSPRDIINDETVVDYINMPCEHSPIEIDESLSLKDYLVDSTGLLP